MEFGPQRKSLSWFWGTWFLHNHLSLGCGGSGIQGPSLCLMLLASGLDFQGFSKSWLLGFRAQGLFWLWSQKLRVKLVEFLGPGALKETEAPNP